MRIFMLAPAVAALFAALLPAQDTTELLNRMKAMEDRIQALEAEVQTLKAQPPGTVAAAVAAAAPALPAVPVEAAAQGPPPGAPLTLGGAGPAAAKVLNPDISVIGDFLGAAGNGANRGTSSLQMHESEVGFQEVIDPYARADFFISFGEHGVDLEEGYLTFTALPAGLQLKVGKMRAAFGRVNPLHNHVLPWTDRPLVSQNLLNGEDGIDDAGLSLSRILPAPKGIFLEGTAQVFRGDTDGVFQADKRSHVSTVGHMRLYRDLNESTNIDLGGSFARGHSPWADAWNQLYGADATLRWKPLRRSIYHSFVARSELVWSRTVRAPADYHHPLRLLRLRRLPVRTALVLRCPLRPLAARQLPANQPADRNRLRHAATPNCTPPGHRRLTAPHLLAQRVQPDPRAASAHAVRRRTHRQRIVVPIPVLHGRSRSASLLMRKSMSKRLFAFAVLLLTAAAGVTQAASKLNVMTATQDLASLAREVGGDLVTADSIAMGYQDPHFVEPKPSFLLKLQKADLLVVVGLQLEIGWLPPLITQSRNARIQVGAPGYLDMSQYCQILEIPTGQVTRAMGDVHPLGNPHYWLDPENGRRIAKELAAKFSEMQPANAAAFAQRFADFDKRLSTAEKGWEARMAPYRNRRWSPTTAPGPTSASASASRWWITSSPNPASRPPPAIPWK